MPKLEQTAAPLGTRVANTARRLTGGGAKDVALPTERGRDPRLPVSTADSLRRAGEGLKTVTKKWQTVRSMSRAVGKR